MMRLKPILSDSPSSFVVYAYRELNNAHSPAGRKKLRWQRTAMCPDLSSALLHAELVGADPGIRRVQIFEQVTDRSGNTRAGRIVRNWRPSPFRRIFAFL